MPDTRFPSGTAQLVAVFVESIFYGTYLVTFIRALRCIIWAPGGIHVGGWTPRFKKRILMLTMVLLLFFFSTLNLALGLVRILQAFISNQHSGSTAVEQLGQDWVNILKALCVNAQTLLADYVLIYRCWVVHSRSWKIVVLPILSWLGGIACTALSIYLQISIASGESRVNGDKMFPVIISTWTLTILLNLYATSTIVLQIWRVVKKNIDPQGLPKFVPDTPYRTRLQTTMKIIIESALMYTVTSLIVFVTLVSGSNSIYITTAVDIQVIGIAFNLILIRAAKNTNEDMGDVSTATKVSRHISFARITGVGLQEANEHRISGDSKEIRAIEADQEAKA